FYLAVANLGLPLPKSIGISNAAFENYSRIFGPFGQIVDVVVSSTFTVLVNIDLRLEPADFRKASDHETFDLDQETKTCVRVITLRSGHSALLICTDFLIDSADLFAPPHAFAVRHLQDVGWLPMKVVGDKGYLLIEPFEGVASDSPGLKLTSICSPQWEH